ncbi:DNA mismatch repair endonuclease MutL [Candidatus Babeliales bacterium]|nr:DNA mismatch repair endonuclease MutL [Candidatus Babeliales bacterium]MCF7899474.1 DNA mismatch repair endonuclease MutL [Candidatus Babeliales bacterium]
MNKIKVLPAQEALKIAAGEVVERPASVVKEIIENSIDAEATQISLFINNAGKDLIRIVDNGCGMSEADAKLCFAIHSTSKIFSLNDIENIQSFGFRGEALASISSISKVTLVTKEENDNSNLGIKLEYIDGKIHKQEEVSCPVGTEIIIKDLFYNTPVRKKFLKRDETEWNQILNIFHAFCLSNLSIHFKLYHDDKLILNAPSVQNVKERTSQIWGHNFAQNLIELTINKDPKIKIYGYISTHNFWRYNRNYVFCFVNNRFIKNKELSSALIKGYLNVLPPARFPAAFLFLELENNLVDINVHPRKEEVKFVKPATVELMLQRSVTQTLENNLSKQLENSRQNNIQNKTQEYANAKISTDPIFFEQNTQAKNISTETTEFLPNFFTKNNFNQNNLNTNIQKVLDQKEIAPAYLNQENLNNINKDISIYSNNSINTQAQENFKIIGQLFKTYILIEKENNFILIDQHAAHERILYEKYLKNFEQKVGIKLLFPEIINLSDDKLEIILQEKEFFKKQGIELELFGQNQIAIKTSPPKLQGNSIKEIIFEAIAFIEENEKLDQDTFRKKFNEHVHSHLACKMAIKAGDLLTFQQMYQLIQDLQKVNNRFICVHGRPTTWSINELEIEKKFQRK